MSLCKIGDDGKLHPMTELEKKRFWKKWAALPNNPWTAPVETFKKLRKREKK